MILTEHGHLIFENIKTHCIKEMGMMEIDTPGMEMIANAFDQYSRCAAILNEKGMTQTAKNGFETLRPEYTIMKNCYDQILKHSDKFGLNPGSRKKIFSMQKAPEKKKGFNLDSKIDRSSSQFLD